MFANMGCAEFTHSSLCDAVIAFFKQGNERWCVLKLFHFLFIYVNFVTGMSVTKVVQR